MMYFRPSNLSPIGPESYVLTIRLSLGGLTFFKTALGYGYGFSYETVLRLWLRFQVYKTVTVKPVQTG